MQKNKVLYTVCTDKYAGTEHQIYLLCKYLKDDFDIAVAASEGSMLLKKLKEINIATYEINFSNIFKAVSSLQKIIKEKEINIVHNNLGKAELAGTLAARLAGVDNIITSKHFIRPAYTYKNGLSKYISLKAHMMINKYNKKLIAVSEAVRETTMKREGVSADKIVTIYNGSDIKPTEVNIKDSKVIGCVARLSTEKGLEYLIEAMKDVVASYPDAKCFIAGEGYLKDTLRGKINDLGLDDKIELLGQMNDIEKFYEKIDVFILPSLEESFGITLVEAMLSGKPVIATKTEGALEVLGNEGGLLVDKASASALSEGIKKLLADKELARKLAISGQKRAISKFSAERMADETAKVYEEVI